jgi:flagellar biosynthetic protein FlhB
MAEESDDSSKTEEPTGQRLDEARKRGQLIHSKEIDHLIGLAVATAVVLIFGPKVMGELRDVGRGLLEHLHQIPLDGGGTGRLLFDVMVRVSLIIALPVLLLLVGAIAPSLLQNGLVIASEALTPKFDRLNP